MHVSICVSIYLSLYLPIYVSKYLSSLFRELEGGRLARSFRRWNRVEFVDKSCVCVYGVRVRRQYYCAYRGSERGRKQGQKGEKLKCSPTFRPQFEKAMLNV